MNHSVSCENSPALSFESMRRVSCETSNGLILEKYRGDQLESPYATEFDQRKVGLAYGQRLNSEFSIFSKNSLSLKLTPPSLITPPLTDQIKSRHIRPGLKVHRNWKIFNEHIEYVAEGGKTGFVLNCATAIRFFEKKAMVIGECFPLEESNLFILTIDSTKPPF